MKTPPAFSAAFGQWLDLLRGLSALIVVLSHLKLFGIATPDFPYWLPGDGHDAVVMFFILSGLMVAASADRKKALGLQSYLLDRMARIASVCVPVLFVAAFLLVAGIIIYPPADYQVARWWFYVPFHLSFLSHSWSLREIPFGLNPWWSLPFEVWYYLLFGGLAFLRDWTRIMICSIILLIMGPSLWMLMPLWFAGVALWRSGWGLQLSQSTAWIFLLVSTLAYFLYLETPGQQMVRDLFLVPFGGWEKHSLGHASYFGRDYVTCFFMLLFLAGLRRLDLQISRPFARIAAAMAGISFTLYLFHPLLFRFLASGWMQPSANPFIVYGIALLAVLASFLIAPFTENQRANWRRLFAAIFSVILPQQRAR